VSLAVQVLLTGLAAGAVYGLVAIGHTIVYRLTGIVHFAFGDLLGLGVFATLLVAAGTGPLTQQSAGATRFLISLAVGFAVAVAAGAAGYLIVVQPFLARRSTIGWVGATLALGVAIRAALEAVFERPSYVFPDPIPFHRLGHEGFITVAGAELRVRAFYVVAVSVVLAAIAAWALTRTRFGHGVQAVAADEEGAAFVGVPVEPLRAVAFGLAGWIAAVAAVAAAPSAPVDALTGALLGLKGLVAALFVRFAGLPHAFVAGLAVGVAEAALGSDALLSGGLQPGVREVLPIAVVLVALALRPPVEAVEEPE
jgi:branched-chain amino acid transport system permease protein